LTCSDPAAVAHHWPDDPGAGAPRLRPRDAGAKKTSFWHHLLILETEHLQKQARDKQHMARKEKETFSAHSLPSRDLEAQGYYMLLGDE
jgi:hypothetical protein